MVHRTLDRTASQTSHTGGPRHASWDGSPSDVPYGAYVDPAVFSQERERIFQGPVWHYVALECEIPSPGDYVSVYIGTTPVVANRAADRGIHAFVNRCAHRGATVVRGRRGHCEGTHTCIYHQWTYDLQGRLVGVPYRRGLSGTGGFPEDFDPGQHGLRTLRVAVLHGIVFATFDAGAPPLEIFLGRSAVERLQRLFSRPVKVIGYQRQQIRANWKLMIENVKDSYHGALLHAFNSKFGFFRSTQRGEVWVSDNGVHSMLTTYDTEGERVAALMGGVTSYKPQLTLADSTMLSAVREFRDPIVTSIVSLFPSFLLLHTLNFLGFRSVWPKSPGEFEMVWTYLGYADDTPQMIDRRLRQLNLFGAGGYVSMEDAHALELTQRAVSGEGGTGTGVAALGGRDTATQDHLVTEVAIRGFWRGWRTLMESRGDDGSAADGVPAGKLPPAASTPGDPARVPPC